MKLLKEIQDKKIEEINNMIFFSTLFGLCIISAYSVVICRNPVYSLLNLVLFFICGSLHLLYLGVDFLAFVFVIVYVGAVAVLFLFVVIILNIKAKKYKYVFKREILQILLASFLILYFFSDTPFYTLSFTDPGLKIPWATTVYDHIPSIKVLGLVLYTRYLVHFVLCGLILLVAIIGAIVLTSKSRLEKPKLSESLSRQHVRSSCIGKFKLI